MRGWMAWMDTQILQTNDVQRTTRVRSYDVRRTRCGAESYRARIENEKCEPASSARARFSISPSRICLLRLRPPATSPQPNRY